eukprot:NODE_842_length_2315_cov_58.014599_g716_i0.p1 GENE.NODE_842_length_2315_cov_58.014599_g716_i0~~NODE_842_length_2315_cov_58.014599_g716_i0.p1  ORF type:complete len:636 (-),score=114.10 NODE_842_length_2315_cov_58.014599_g716_i0:318-2225(-)
MRSPENLYYNMTLGKSNSRQSSPVTRYVPALPVTPMREHSPTHRPPLPHPVPTSPPPVPVRRSSISVVVEVKCEKPPMRRSLSGSTPSRTPSPTPPSTPMRSTPITPPPPHLFSEGSSKHLPRSSSPKPITRTIPIKLSMLQYDEHRERKSLQLKEMEHRRWVSDMILSERNFLRHRDKASKWIRDRMFPRNPNIVYSPNKAQSPSSAVYSPSNSKRMLNGTPDKKKISNVRSPTNFSERKNNHSILPPEPEKIDSALNFGFEREFSIPTVTLQTEDNPPIVERERSVTFSNETKGASSGMLLEAPEDIPMLTIGACTPRMDTPPNLGETKNKIETFSRQASGHKGSFFSSQTELYKEFTKIEFDALSRLHSDPLGKWAPEFHGVELVEGKEMLKMQDLTSGMTFPNTMDLKIGVRTFLESECSSNKRRPDLLEKAKELRGKHDFVITQEQEEKGFTKLEYLRLRDEISSTVNLGFRIDGMLLNPGEKKTDCRAIGNSREEVKSYLEMYLKKASSKQKDAMMGRLKDIRSVLDTSDFFKTSEVIGSSLLFVYDTNTSGAGVWIIDFGKTLPVPEDITLTHNSEWILGNHEDGYLMGLDNIISIMEEIMSSPSISSMSLSKKTSDDSGFLLCIPTL